MTEMHKLLYQYCKVSIGNAVVAVVAVAVAVLIIAFYANRNT